MKNFAVIASTKGTDLQALIDNAASLKANLAFVFCNNECGALEKARKYGIKHAMISHKGKKREDFDNEMDAQLKKHEIDFVVMIGFNRILSNQFVQKWRNKLMNIHPSLLPAFEGAFNLDIHKAVLDRGCKVSGCTLHFVYEEVDKGPIIIQKAIEVEQTDTPNSLKDKVQEAEKEAVIEGINLMAEDRLKVEDGVVKVKE